jgi:hypothetical protein
MTTDLEVAELGPKGEALVDDLAENGGAIRLTRDGKPLAMVMRVVNSEPLNEGARDKDDEERLRNDGPLAGSILYEGDIVSPLNEEWDAAK